MPSVSAAIVGRGGRVLELAPRVQVRPVPVEPRGERAGPRELLDVAVGVAVVAQPLAEQAPVVALQELLGDALELEQELVPRGLALADRALRERARVADGHRHELAHAFRMRGGEQPRDKRAEVVPDDVRLPISRPSRIATASATLCRDRVRLDVLGALRLAPARAGRARCSASRRRSAPRSGGARGTTSPGTRAGAARGALRPRPGPPARRRDVQIASGAATS